MPFYHFDIADAFPPIAAEAIELETISEARCHALTFAGQILCDQHPDFWDADE